MSEKIKARFAIKNTPERPSEMTLGMFGANYNPKDKFYHFSGSPEEYSKLLRMLSGKGIQYKVFLSENELNDFFAKLKTTIERDSR